MSVKIITDSASDIIQDEAKKLGIEVLPITIEFGKDEYLDGINLSHKEFYEKLVENKDFPKTSQINPFTYSECYKKYENDEVVMITISSKLSGCYQNAVLAASDYKNVYVVDSKNVAIGQGLLVKYAVRLAKEGKSAEEIADILNRDKGNIVVLAVLDTLEYLKKGGRISPTQAFVGGLLNIKPVVQIMNGEVYILGKARGSKNGNSMLKRHIISSGGFDFSMPYTAAFSGFSDEMIKKFLEESKELYEIDIKDMPICSIGATIGTHTGPGVVAVAFFSKNK